MYKRKLFSMRTESPSLTMPGTRSNCTVSEMKLGLIHGTKRNIQMNKDNENDSLRQNILMTADAEIWNHNTNQFERLIILFDSGSHLSFIQESHSGNVRLALELPCQG
uniref:DUF1758 domain-containing protein n=1 Tax=Heterorhabditis bacteriophora TaxID=37862 RepID=A0A1I7WJC1_HETBA